MNPDVGGDAAVDTVVPGAVLSGTTSHDYGVLIFGGSISPVSWVITNIGDTSTGQLQLTTDTTGSLSVGQNGCTGTLAPGAMCTIQLTLKNLGLPKPQLTVNASPGGSVVFTANFAFGALTLAPESADLGNVFVGSSADTTFQLSNPTPQASSGITFSLGTFFYGTGFDLLNFSAPIAGDCTGAPLTGGASCNIRIRFVPYGPGDQSTYLAVSAPIGGMLGAASVVGHGVRHATLTAATRHNFGTIPAGSTSPTFTWTVSNGGDVATGGLSLSNDNPSELVMGASTCTGPIGFGDLCTIALTFRPSADTPRSGTLTVTASPGGSVALTAAANGPLTGTAVAFPIDPSSNPAAITAGSDGALWFTDGANSAIGRITPSGGVREFAVNDPLGGLSGITLGADGNIWFTGETSVDGITPTGSLVAGPGSQYQRLSITADPAGFLWCTGTGLDENPEPPVTTAMVFNFSPSSPSTGGYQFPTKTDLLPGIAVGPDGNLWITEPSLNAVARMTPSGMIGPEVTLPTANSAPWHITAGPDGNMWFVEQAGNNIGRITPFGSVTEFPIPTTISPLDITAGPDGNLWFIGSGQYGRVTPQGVITAFPGAGGGASVTTGPDGNLWAAGHGQILRITP
jgi:streptogramin lyase